MSNTIEVKVKLDAPIANVSFNTSFGVHFNSRITLVESSLALASPCCKRRYSRFYMLLNFDDTCTKCEASFKFFESLGEPEIHTSLEDPNVNIPESWLQEKIDPVTTILVANEISEVYDDVVKILQKGYLNPPTLKKVHEKYGVTTLLAN